jgi:hypothetical protein
MTQHDPQKVETGFASRQTRNALRRDHAQSGRARESTVGGIQGVWTPSETRLAPDSTMWIGGSSGCSDGEKRDPATAAAMKRNDRVAPASLRPAGRSGGLAAIYVTNATT